MFLNMLWVVGFDVVIDFDDVISYECFKLFVDLWVISVIGFNKEFYKFYDYLIVFFDGNSYIFLCYKQVVKLFGIVDDCLYYYYFFGCCYEWEKVVCLFFQVGEVELCIVINFFIVFEDKDFCCYQVVILVEWLYVLFYWVCIVMVGCSEKICQLGLDMVLYIVDSIINFVVEVICSCDLVIMLDILIVYIVWVFDKLMVVVYNKCKFKNIGLFGYYIWVLGYDKVKQIVCEEVNVVDVVIELVWFVIKEQVDWLVVVCS